jgi:GT2 family glycosyltransferase
MAAKVWFVSATRFDRPAFESRAPLALSLARASAVSPFVLAVAYANADPLAIAYGRALDAAQPGDLMAFVHDDAWIDDWCVVDRVREALATFDVAGVAGNRERRPGQRSWLDAEDLARIGDDHLSGAIAHRDADGRVTHNRYGAAPAPVKLLDGVFLAARVDALRAQGVRFDPRFPFHCYDMDFCRSCERAGLALGTWPIAITHASGGRPQGADFDAAQRAYFDKWGA